MASPSAVRVRFAPSPTGGLHLGGVRTVLYNYLFAKKHQGTFVLRIEDTDQTRFVEGAEKYIFDCLQWCGIEPDESTLHGGHFGPYRQSERKSTYLQYALQLIQQGNAYYAFDTPEELNAMREKFRSEQNPSPQYDGNIRMHMKNGLTLTNEEVQTLISNGTPYVIRIKMPTNETISFTDMIHGEVQFDSNTVDDKVLLKADGMPTYHLAVVVDDYLMKISHAFRGEEWLSSAPVHILLWKYLFSLEQMPHWAHLPLILGPSGKLSKRDGAKYGFPVFAMNWTDPRSNEFTEGFKEKGFLPDAFINMLAMLGWNSGSEQELFSKHELIQQFSIDRVHKSGAKFDYDKARWFNQEWIKRKDAPTLYPLIKPIWENAELSLKEDAYQLNVIELIKDRCVLLSDFIEQGAYFFKEPDKFDIEAIQAKWSAEKTSFFQQFNHALDSLNNWTTVEIETCFKSLATSLAIKPGDVQLPFRIMLVGGKFGPPVFDIASMIGMEATQHRIKHVLTLLN